MKKSTSQAQKSLVIYSEGWCLGFSSSKLTSWRGLILYLLPSHYIVSKENILQHHNLYHCEYCMIFVNRGCGKITTLFKKKVKWNFLKTLSKTIRQFLGLQSLSLLNQKCLRVFFWDERKCVRFFLDMMKKTVESVIWNGFIKFQAKLNKNWENKNVFERNFELKILSFSR